MHVGHDSSGEIEAIAEAIAATGVKSRDSIHVASAIFAACDYFISTDDRLLKYESDKIKLVNPMDFIRLEVEYDSF